MAQTDHQKLKYEEKHNRRKINSVANEKKRTESERSRKYILMIGLIIVIVGIVILLITIIYNSIYMDYVKEGIALRVCQVIDNLLLCIGTTLMTIGAGTALYSYFDFVNYMQQKIKSVIIDNDFTDNLSDECKKDLACKLEKEILHQNEDNNLYDFVQDEVLTLAKLAYYEEFILNVSCKKIGNEIHKSICKDYVINCDSQPDFDIVGNNAFSMQCKDNCDDKPVKNIKLNINGLDFSSDDYTSNGEKTEGEVYNKNCRYILNEASRKRIDEIKNNDRWDYKYTVRSEMTSVVKDDDVTFSFRLYYPCRNTTFIFTYNPDEFEVMEDVFVFKDTDMEENNLRKAITTRRNKGSIYVKINNWVLPGDGITFVFSPLKNIK